MADTENTSPDRTPTRPSAMALLFDFESPIFEVACIARTLILMTDGDIWEDEDGPAVGWLGCKLWDIAKQLDALFRKKTEGEDRAE